MSNFCCDWFLPPLRKKESKCDPDCSGGTSQISSVTTQVYYPENSPVYITFAPGITSFSFALHGAEGGIGYDQTRGGKGQYFTGSYNLSQFYPPPYVPVPLTFKLYIGTRGENRTRQRGGNGGTGDGQGGKGGDGVDGGGGGGGGASSISLVSNYQTPQETRTILILASAGGGSGATTASISGSSGLGGPGNGNGVMGINGAAGPGLAGKNGVGGNGGPGATYGTSGQTISRFPPNRGVDGGAGGGTDPTHNPYGGGGGGGGGWGGGGGGGGGTYEYKGKHSAGAGGGGGGQYFDALVTGLVSGDISYPDGFVSITYTADPSSLSTSTSSFLPTSILYSPRITLSFQKQKKKNQRHFTLVAKLSNGRDPQGFLYFQLQSLLEEKKWIMSVKVNGNGTYRLGPFPLPLQASSKKKSNYSDYSFSATYSGDARNRAICSSSFSM